MNPFLSKWNITTQVTWLAAIFMSLDSMDLELVMELVIDMQHMPYMLHLPTSSNIYHLHSCTKSNIFAIWLPYRGLGELALSSIAGPKAYPNTWNWMDRQPRDIGESSPVIFLAKWSHSPIGLDDRWHTFTIWLFNIAMENGPFIDGLPSKDGDFPWLC